MLEFLELFKILQETAGNYGVKALVDIWEIEGRLLPTLKSRS